MFVLVAKFPGQTEQKRWVASQKSQINHLLSIAEGQYGKDGFHYRIWNNGWAQSSFEAWRHIQDHTGPATVI